MNFSLPPEVTVQSQVLNDGKVYQFRHKTLGLLGRIVLRGSLGGQCHISSEIAGDPSDPMTDKRAAIFQPLSDQLVIALETALGIARKGKGPAWTGTPATAAPLPSPSELVKSEQIPCEQCGAIAAHLIFADNARSVGELEDYARKMYAIYKKVNVPTWIIGAPQGIPSDDTPALTMKVWPKRQAAKRLSPNAFNPKLDALLARHCHKALKQPVYRSE